MTNGPYAKVAESVSVSLPRPRNRAEVVKNPDYYKIRNYLVDFLVERSDHLAGSEEKAEEKSETVYVDPTIDKAVA
jgi:nitrate/nitrite transport system ATP-binding protein